MKMILNAQKSIPNIFWIYMGKKFENIIIFFIVQFISALIVYIIMTSESFTENDLFYKLNPISIIIISLLLFSYTFYYRSEFLFISKTQPIIMLIFYGFCLLIVPMIINIFYPSQLDTNQYTFLFLFSYLVSAPVCEELFFRGLILSRTTRQGYGEMESSIAVSLLFASMHLNDAMFFKFIQLFYFSLMLCLLRFRSNSVLVPIVFHSALNGVSLYATQAIIEIRTIF